MPELAVLSLPIDDRRRSFAFYGDGLGFEPVGEPAEDGVPEPLQFAVGEHTNLMLIPRVGFGWILGEREPAPRDHSECVLVLAADTEDGVDTIVARAHGAGATVVTEPGRQPWGYAGVFADPDGHVWMARLRG